MLKMSTFHLNQFMSLFIIYLANETLVTYEGNYYYLVIAVAQLVFALITCHGIQHYTRICQTMRLLITFIMNGKFEKI